MRSKYWDEYKGLAVIAVIAIHACGGTEKFPVSSLNWHFGLLFRQVVDFAVPFFFAVSGYYSLPRKNDAGSVNWAEYYKRRLMRVLPPYIIWTTIFIVIFRRDHIFSLVEIVKDFVFGMGVGIGYYVVVLIQYYLLVPLIDRVKEKRVDVFVMICISFFGLLYSYITRVRFPELIIAEFPYNVLLFFVWYPFFHLGVYARKYGFSEKGMGYIPYALVAALLFSMLEAEALAGVGLYSVGVSQVKLSSYLYSILFFVLLVMRSSGPSSSRLNESILSNLGRRSYVVYLSHLLFLQYIQRGLLKISYVYNMQIVYIALSTLLTLGLCFLLLIVIDKFLPKKAQGYIGL